MQLLEQPITSRYRFGEGHKSTIRSVVNLVARSAKTRMFSVLGESCTLVANCPDYGAFCRGSVPWADGTLTAQQAPFGLQFAGQDPDQHAVIFRSAELLQFGDGLLVSLTRNQRMVG